MVAATPPTYWHCWVTREPTGGSRAVTFITQTVRMYLSFVSHRGKTLVLHGDVLCTLNLPALPFFLMQEVRNPTEVSNLSTGCLTYSSMFHWASAVLSEFSTSLRPPHQTNLWMQWKVSGRVSSGLRMEKKLIVFTFLLGAIFAAEQSKLHLGNPYIPDTQD